ncbi:MAC/perforin domain-containing protein [Chromobacterium subtsugae]|uniref:MAC/perforin domain-containing protein n=1 Tax=Chromobacterium subtsugae TaxID=251747 RepID=UPI000B1259B4|nr:MAC/perforin domain-containing protein [Chromobacterium subtsugae]
MTFALVLVEKTNGEKRNFRLELEATLRTTRTKLTEASFMSASDDFLVNNAPIDRNDETELQLNDLWTSSEAKVLRIGSADNGLPVPDKTVDRYNKLDTQQKLSLFNNLQIYHGITVSPENGFGRTFKACIASWQPNQLPAAIMPNFITKVVVESTFNEVSHSLTTSSVEKGSVSLTTPYGGGESGFEYAKSQTTESKKVTEYLSAKFLVNKVVLDVDIANLQLVEDFEQQVLDAVRSSLPIDQYDKLIRVLNERGYYIPKRFTLGGSITSTETTKVWEYSESESEKREFSVGFKIAIKGFGGGGDYSNSQGSESSNSQTSKYSNLTLSKKGGQADASNYAEWTKTLNPAINWDVISYDELYPTLALLKDKRLLHFCLNVLENYYTYPTVIDKQKIIHIGQYVTRVQSLLSSSGTGIG